MSRPWSLALYGVVTGLLEPIAPLVLASRMRRGKEDPGRLAERLGRPTAARPAGPLVWLHGASVGESLSLLPLIERLQAKRPDLALLVTTGTTTSASLLAQRLPAGVIHQYVPIDAPKAAARFVNYWRPAMVIFAESDLWPNLIWKAKASGARLALVSARITEKSARGWTRAPAAAQSLFSTFDLILPQDEGSAGRIGALGGKISDRLNLKVLAGPLPCDEIELARLKKQIGGRAVVLGASTHPGEDELIAWAVEETRLDPLLVLAPRHPTRGSALAAALDAPDRPVALRSAGQPISRDTAIYVADTLGEMGLFFRLADVAVMGGSFLRGIGGHNPLEAARLGVPVIVGEDRSNFTEVYDDLLEDGLAEGSVSDAEDLRCVLQQFLTQPERARAMGEAARAYAAEEASAAIAAMDRVVELAPR